MDQNNDLDSLTYRHATLDDLDNIMLINEQFEHKWTIEKFQDIFDNQIPFILVHSSQGDLIGYLVYFIVLDEARIINIAISKQYQNKSYGRRLIHYALEEMYNSNVHYALLDVKTNNFPAINLYTKMGFQILCRRVDYYVGDVEGDSYFMQLRL